MDAQRGTLVLLALMVLLGDAWLDWSSWQHGALSAAEAGSAAVRTLLLLATLAALVHPTRRLVQLALLAWVMAVIRRALFLWPMLAALSPSGFLSTFYSGLDVGFRVALLGWALSWLHRRGAAN